MVKWWLNESLKEIGDLNCDINEWFSMVDGDLIAYLEWELQIWRLLAWTISLGLFEWCVMNFKRSPKNRVPEPECWNLGTLAPGSNFLPPFQPEKMVRWNEKLIVWVESLYTQRRPVLQLNFPFWPSRIFVGEFRFVWLADLKHRISLLLVIPSGQKAWQWKSIQFQVANHSHVHFCSPKCYATNYVYFPTSLFLALKSTKKLTFFSLTLDLFGELLPPFLHVFAISFSLFEPIFFLIQYL